jgi:hypothetical protein
MENRLGFGDEIGNSSSPFKLPHIQPETLEQHTQNAAETERQINRVKTGIAHYFTTKAAVDIEGDDTVVNLTPIRFTSEYIKMELYLAITPVTLMDSVTTQTLDIANPTADTPNYIQALPSPSLSSLPTAQYARYSTFVIKYQGAKDVVFTQSCTTLSGLPAKLSYGFILTPMIVYQD